MTLNEELEHRNDELAHVNNDLLNLLASVDLTIVMLDSFLRIRRFNPSAQRTLNLIPADAGRSIRDLSLTLEIQDLDAMIASVIDTLEVRELRVEDRAGHSYLLRIRPYKTADNKIDGAVLVMIDIEQLKKKIYGQTGCVRRHRLRKKRSSKPLTEGYGRMEVLCALYLRQ